MDRRGFLKTHVGAGLAAVTPLLSGSAAEPPMRPLGKIGARLSVLAFVGGSHVLVPEIG